MAFDVEWRRIVVVETGTFGRNEAKMQEKFMMKKSCCKGQYKMTNKIQ